MQKRDALHTFCACDLRSSNIVIQFAAINGVLQELGKNGKEAADVFERYTLPALQRRLGAVRRGILSRIQGIERSETAVLGGAHTAIAGLLHSV